MVEHDVRCGQMYVDLDIYPDRFTIAYMEPILARGLASICSLQACTSYKSKISIMCPDEPWNSEVFLYHALEAANDSNDRLDLEDYTPEDEINNITPLYFKDPDPGPEEVWRLIHELSTRANFVNGEAWHLHREWGYVMWDRTTLEEMGIFEEDWDEDGRALYIEARSMELRVASQKRREQIHFSGGRGWWSFDDESKIIWPGGQEPQKCILEEESKAPETLEEAKALILSVR